MCISESSLIPLVSRTFKNVIVRQLQEWKIIQESVPQCHTGAQGQQADWRAQGVTGLLFNKCL